MLLLARLSAHMLPGPPDLLRLVPATHSDQTCLRSVPLPQEILEKLVDLMMDPFGNYLIQKLLDRCSEEQRLQVGPGTGLSWRGGGGMARALGGVARALGGWGCEGAWMLSVEGLVVVR